MIFDLSWANLLLGVLAILFTGSLSFVSWKRSEYRWQTGLLECVRLLLVALAVATLMQPEVVRSTTPDSSGTVAVLIDRSRSMNTEDVSAAAGYHSRATEISPLKEASYWSDVATNKTVVIESFDSSQVGEKGTNMEEAIEKVVAQHSDLQSIVLASDGDWNIGSNPVGIARSLRARGIPIHTVGVGSEDRLPDLAVQSFEVPTFAIVGKPLRLPFTISSSLPHDVDIPVELELPEGKQQQTVRVPAMGMGTGTMEWRPMMIGETSVSIRIGKDPRDRFEENNERKVSVSIRNESLRVLLIESYPRWEYRYTRNALERDPGVEVNCYMVHPDLSELGGGRGYLDAFPDEPTLFGYDVVFLGDIGMGPNELSIEQCQLLQKLVQFQAGGLVLMPGLRGKQRTLTDSPLGELFPVEIDRSQPRGVGTDRPSPFRLTELGHQSLLTRFEATETLNDEIWRSLPGFYWYAAVDKARPGSQVLATHDRDSNRHGRIPLIVTKTYGNGKVLFMGSDGAWRWRKGVEDKFHYRFWGQVVRWMSYQRSMARGDSLRLFHAPDRPNEGDLVTLQATVMSATGEPLQTGSVNCQITSPSGEVETVSLLRDDPNAWGLFRGQFKPKMGGEYKLLTRCKETGKSIESNLYVQTLDREQIGKPARLDVMRELAIATRGEYTPSDKVQQIINLASVEREKELIVQRIQIWSHPAWGGFIVFLLGLFWAGRKWVGLV